MILPDAACVAAASDASVRCMGELTVIGSLQNVHADAAGSIDCGGSVAGGRIVCGGVLRCGSVGEAGRATSVWVGAPPHDARGLVDAGWRQDGLIARELEALGPGDRTRRLELDERRRGISWRLTKLAAACGGGSLEVSGTLHPGVSLRIGLRPERYTFIRAIAGPLEVFAEEGGHALLRQGQRLTRLEGSGGWVRG